MSFSYMDWIEKYDLNFQLHINESEDNPLFKQISLKEEVDNLLKYNKTIVDVVSTQKINGNYYYKIKYKGTLLGWCCPSENSIMYLRTRRHEIKLFYESNIDNELNSFIKNDLSKLKDNWIKIFICDFFAIFQGKVYCAVILKDDLLGFVELENISFFTDSRNNFKFVEGSVTLYKDSKLEKIKEEAFNHNNESYTSLGWFENFDGVRVIVDGRRYWVNKDQTNIDVKNIKLETTLEIVIDTLIFQLQDKVLKQSEFYNSKIKKLEKDLDDYKEKEKLINQSVKNFKEIL